VLPELHLHLEDKACLKTIQICNAISSRSLYLSKSLNFIFIFYF
jgi:hypothetical protein